MKPPSRKWHCDERKGGKNSAWLLHSIGLLECDIFVTSRTILLQQHPVGDQRRAGPITH
jgi:hypothetical protein